MAVAYQHKISHLLPYLETDVPRPLANTILVGTDFVAAAAPEGTCRLLKLKNVRVSVQRGEGLPRMRLTLGTPLQTTRDGDGNKRRDVCVTINVRQV